MIRWFLLISALVGLAVGVVFISSAWPRSQPDPVSLPTPVFYPVSAGQPAPSISAQHVFILDLNSQQVLFQLSAAHRLYPASTTKMMTALVALDHFPLDRTITISHTFSQGQHLGFSAGETVTVEQLLYSLLVYSANDAAEILAENYPGGRPAFVAAMNSQARSLRLFDTHFSNPTGLDEPDHYSTAADLTRLSEVVIAHPVLSKIVSTETAVISSSTSPHIVSNVNELLGQVPGVLGIKTGYTDLAGQSLITYIVRDHHPVIITLLKSQDRFADTRALIDWVYSNFNWIQH